jgi:DNA-binding transcriptional regulator GbsR (MarR family)
VVVSPDEAEFVDRMGLFMEMLGAPKTMGRIYGWLMISDPPHQSLTELAGMLEVSKASVSTVIRPMQEGGLVERLPSSARQHHYRLTPGGFTHVVQVQLERVIAGAAVAELGLAVLGRDRAEERERMAEFRDFCEFSGTEFRDLLMDRWEHYRATRKGEDR